MAFLFGKHNHADSHGTIQTDSKPMQAPEIDPGTALTAILLLAGMLAVLMGKRRA
ncbi:MAG: hypothetical protein RB191_02835 [Terriglobia bacterium]|nr:hypothetical protein [Terriglobia bacterium]